VSRDRLPPPGLHERLRKIKPQYTEGELVRVAVARNQAEAEFLQGMLLEEGVPSTVRRARGFDVPDMLAAGPRELLVAASGWATAREVLLEAEVVDDRPPETTSPARLAAGLLGGVGLVGLLVWVGTLLTG
jgi:hypothetical protein